MRRSMLIVALAAAAAVLALPGWIEADSSPVVSQARAQADEPASASGGAGAEPAPPVSTAEEVCLADEPMSVVGEYHISCNHRICYTLCGPAGGYPVSSNLCLCC